MFVKKVLISLTLVAVIPVALSRHLSQWGTQVFPDDVVENIPAENIEDLQIGNSDVRPDFDSRHNFENQRGTPNADTDDQDLGIFADGENVLSSNVAARDSRDSVVRVNPLNDYPAMQNGDTYDYPVFEDNKQEEEPIVPKDLYVPAKRMTARNQGPRIIVVERPDDQQYPDVDITKNEIPHGQENNNDNRTWDDDEMTNEIPNNVASNPKWM